MDSNPSLCLRDGVNLYKKSLFFLLAGTGAAGTTLASQGNNDRLSAEFLDAQTKFSNLELLVDSLEATRNAARKTVAGLQLD